MRENALTPTQILDSAEAVLRRFGPEKSTVVDVAKALDVSHGSIYRHFSSKTALHEAVIGRWLGRMTWPLENIAGGDEAPHRRLRLWLVRHHAVKAESAIKDPELFATYAMLSKKPSPIIDALIRQMLSQIEGIVRAGGQSGVFQTDDPPRTARAVYDATIGFHDPSFSSQWSSPADERRYDAVLNTVIAGLMQ